ncbi:MAG: hypothetical protein E7111_03235 [Bacteroidales bacterium]|nr:hypothetical protein [Bacteroidales bacterium]
MKKILFFLVLMSLCAGLFVTSCDDGLESETNVELGGIDDAGSGNEEIDDEQTPPSTDGVQTQKKGPMTLSLSAVTPTTATFNTLLDVEQMADYQEAGFIYSTIDEMDIEATHVSKVRITREMSSTKLKQLLRATEYYYTIYLCKNGVYMYGETQGFVTPPFDSNLSVDGTANCYIVDRKGTYSYYATEGNSDVPMRDIASVSVLWESFGTSIAPLVGDLIKSVSYADDYITFQTADTFKEGNAVVAAKDDAGNILWSWHIWLTDQPLGQTYYNNAGTMMDRNLGATSATPGEVGALGLLYQWGRKDPFLGSSSISSETTAKSTISWPSPVSSNSGNGTIEYATAHPTTSIKRNDVNYDWYYTGSSSTDNSRWQSSKTIYDPCPAGWRVPDGGDDGVWSKAGFDDTTYDSINEGISFSISSPSITWYPASGCRSSLDGGLVNVGDSGYYWSASPNSDSSYYAFRLSFSSSGGVYPSSYNYRASGFAVRCARE